MKSHILNYSLILGMAIAVTSLAHADHHKKPVDLVGVWNVTASTDDGERELTWTFAKDGDGVSGISVDGESGDERKLDRIKVEEKKVMIETDFERDGSEGVIKVLAEEKEAGKLTGKWSIEGADGTEFMSGDLSATKEIEIAFAGDWNATSVLPDGSELSSVLQLTGGNSSLKGSFKGDGNTLEIDKITAEGKSLRLAFDMEIQGNPTDVVIETELKEEHKLNGKWIVKGPDGTEAATGDWSATREPKLDLSGDWAVTAGLPEGDEYSGTVSLKSDGGTYTGELKSSDGDATEVKSVKVEGKDVVLTFDYEGNGVSGLLTIATKHKEDGSLEGKWNLVGDDGEEIAGDWVKASQKSEKSGVIEGR